MKRNRLYLAFVFAFLLTFVVGVYAADGEVEFSDPSTMPGNVFYGMDLFFEDMRVYFADTKVNNYTPSAEIDDVGWVNRIGQYNFSDITKKIIKSLYDGGYLK